MNPEKFFKQLRAPDKPKPICANGPLRFQCTPGKPPYALMEDPDFLAHRMAHEVLAWWLPGADPVFYEPDLRKWADWIRTAYRGAAGNCRWFVITAAIKDGVPFLQVTGSKA